MDKHIKNLYSGLRGAGFLMLIWFVPVGIILLWMTLFEMAPVLTQIATLLILAYVIGSQLNAKQIKPPR